MALLALAAPAGAAIAFSDDSNPATITTQTRNNNGGGTPPPTEMPNNMNGMDGNDMMGGMEMPPADTMAPTVTSIVGMRGTGANENQITWVVTFSEAVTNIEMAHFILSPAGGMFGTVPAASSGESNTISFTTTHDENNDGMVTLMFDASAGSSQVQDLAMNMIAATADVTSSAVDIDLTPAGTMDFLTSLPTTATSRTSLSGVSGSGGSVQRLDAVGTHTGGTTRIRIGGSTGTVYTFASHQSADGFLLDNNNSLLVVTDQATNVGVSLLFVGSNIGQANSAFTDVLAQTNTSLELTPVSSRPSSTVNYTGRYLISRLPSGTAAYDSAFYTGSVNATWDFSQNTGALSGTTTPDADSTTHGAGTLLSGTITPVNNTLNYGFAGWQGTIAGETSNTTIPFTGSFYGSGATAFTGAGRTASGTETIIAIYGEQ